MQTAITGLVCSKWAEKCLSSVLSVGLEVATKSLNMYDSYEIMVE